LNRKPSKYLLEDDVPSTGPLLTHEGKIIDFNAIKKYDKNINANFDDDPDEFDKGKNE